jgi:hypothetical protein
MTPNRTTLPEKSVIVTCLVFLLFNYVPTQFFNHQKILLLLGRPTT